MEDACFWPSEDSDADSYETQQAAFEMQARFAANMLLLGEDAAIIERVREAMREHVSWLIPKDRAITMHAVNHKVEAAFVDPAVNFALQFQVQADESPEPHDEAENDAPQVTNEDGSNVVTVDFGKKK